MRELRLIGIKLPLIEKPINLSEIIVSQIKERGIEIEDKDIIIVTSKLILKSLGKVIDLKKITPSFKAKIISRLTGKDPVETEIVLHNSKRCLFITPTNFLMKYVNVLGKNPLDASKAVETVKAIMFVETGNGFIATDAGLDYSNMPSGYAIVNNYDFDEIAEELREKIKSLTGKNIGIVIADTEFTISNGKFGTMDMAVGSAGINPLSRELGSRDLYGRPKFGGLDIVVDELCAAAALLMKQSREGIPIVLVKGLEYEESDLHVKDVLITKFEKESRGILLSLAIKNLFLRLIKSI